MSDPKSHCALVRAATDGGAGMFAMFGGQGYSYMEDLRALYTFDAESNTGGEEQIVTLIQRSSAPLCASAVYYLFLC